MRFPAARETQPNIGATAWAAACTVSLDARTHGLVLRVGRCVDESGKGLAGAIVFAATSPARRARAYPG